MVVSLRKRIDRDRVHAQLDSCPRNGGFCTASLLVRFGRDTSRPVTNISCRVVFVASGSRCLEEACRSAASCKAAMPDIPVSLWSDGNTPVPASLFDSVSRLSQPRFCYIDKIEPLTRSPYSRTLFVDSDTYFLGSVYEIFEMLHRFDMAYVQSPVRISPWAGNSTLDIPACFPDANTGVIAFNKSDLF